MLPQQDVVDVPFRAASGQHETTTSAWAMRYVPRWMRFENAPVEATGLSVDVYAKATIIMSSLFLGPALLELATDAAEQACRDEGTENCNDNAKIYGFRPSSLLSNIAVVSGLLCATFLPLFGAIVDHTPYRRQVGSYTAVALVVVKGSEVMVGRRTWFLAALLQIVSGALYNVHNASTYAYTSELAPDAATQTVYNTSFSVILYVSTLVFMVLVLVPSHALDLGDLGTARVSQTVTASVSAIAFYWSWTFLFGNRPTLRHVPDGMNILSCGFRKVMFSIRRIRRRFPALLWLMAAIAFAEGASATLLTIATTFTKDFLDMDSTEIGSIFLVVLLCGIPGSKMAAYLASRQVNPIHNIISCNVLFAVTTSAAALFLHGPEDKEKTYLFAACWGICLGWLHPMETSAYVSLIEKGQETEMMGIYLLLCQILTWLPPLLFTFLNEYGFKMGIGLASLSIFFVIAILCLLSMGKYEDALSLLHEVNQENVELSSGTLLCYQPDHRLAKDDASKMLS